jgi:hypothetical protein
VIASILNLKNKQSIDVKQWIATSFTDGIVHEPHYHDPEPDIAGAEQHF